MHTQPADYCKRHRHKRVYCVSLRRQFKGLVNNARAPRGGICAVCQEMQAVNGGEIKTPIQTIIRRPFHLSSRAPEPMYESGSPHPEGVPRELGAGLQLRHELVWINRHSLKLSNVLFY